MTYLKQTQLFAAAALTMAAAFAATDDLVPAAQAGEHHAMAPKPNKFWWPETLDLTPLRQNAAASDPMGAEFDYAAEFTRLDLTAIKEEVAALMTQSQDWWPADYGHYGPFFVRMAWHSAGTYRVADGRGGAGGGQQRFEPLNSWPDNANLDKARRLLWPVKQKYGRSISWADLMVLAGNVAMESMGFETLGFAGGRTDDWQAELVYWGPETEMLDAKRYHGERKLARPLAAVQMGLIYVNPQGPNGNNDPLAAAADIRETFGRMAMNDEETVALIAGGHTFGKAHGAHKADECVDAEPAAMGVERQGFGWDNKCGEGKGADTVTSGLEGAWSVNPAAWTHQYLTNLFAYEWVQTKSPAGATQWIPADDAAAQLVPDAHDPSKRHAPIMFTTDLSLKMDPAYREVSKRFLDNPKEFEAAFARAWFKLTHRDMGPRARYLGDEVPSEAMSWQDPVPAVNHTLIDGEDITALKAQILDAGLSVPELIRTAWASASSFRATDMRGGANGARILLDPQRGWAVNDVEEIDRVVAALKSIQKKTNKKQKKSGKKVSMADLIVLAGVAAVEKASADAGQPVTVTFRPGRTDATQEQTDIASFGVLEPTFDGFRNYYADGSQDAHPGYVMSPSAALVERADFLDLSVQEMTVLVGGMRALDANAGNSKHGVFTEAPGTLSNDFFTNLLDMSTKWAPKEDEEGVFEGRDRSSGEVKWTATEVDLVFGSNSELRAVVEVYAFADAKARFMSDFAAAWSKLMELDRFDLR